MYLGQILNIKVYYHWKYNGVTNQIHACTNKLIYFVLATSQILFLLRASLLLVKRSTLLPQLGAFLRINWNTAQKQSRDQPQLNLSLKSTMERNYKEKTNTDKEVKKKT